MLDIVFPVESAFWKQKMALNNFFYLVRYVFIFYLLGLQGCAPANILECHINVSVTQDGLVEFEIESAGINMPEIDHFDVIEARDEKWDFNRPVWSLSLPLGHFMKVGKVVYGQPIIGFASIPAYSIVVGKHYLAMVDGAGIDAGVEFLLEEFNGKLRIRRLGNVGAHPHE